MILLLISVQLMIPAEYTNAVDQFPVALQQLIKAELAAGNSIVEIRSGSPAPRAGACLKLAKQLLSRPRASDKEIQYYLRNNGSYDGKRSGRYNGEITDAKQCFFILEPTLSPEDYPDMNAIRAGIEALQRAADADMSNSSRS